MNLTDTMDQFDINNPDLPDVIKDAAFSDGDYPYDKRMDKDEYEAQLETLQIELVKLQTHMQANGKRLVLVFEGRDAAGKGGAIKRYTQYLNPRNTRIVALPKPSDREMGQWYFQRYAAHLPTAGETVLYDRSWYNRAVVEPVMGFCTPKQTKNFLNDVPQFEQMIADEGIVLVKFWLNIGRATQLERFHDRRHNPLVQWKLSPIDLKALSKWDDYTAARNKMFEKTDGDDAHWTVVRANDKRRARLGVIRTVLKHMDYEGKDLGKDTKPAAGIVLSAKEFLNSDASRY